MLIFLVVIGGIYGGIFTPTEAASIGALATAFVAWRSGGLKGRGFLECLYGTAAATGMIFLIMLGADILNVFLALTSCRRSSPPGSPGSASRRSASSRRSS